MYNRAVKRIIWVVCAAAGIVGGAAAFTFYYAKGLSYLSNDPKACMNCHVMTEYYDSWQRGSHHRAATCNDCHVPHAIPEKFIVKGRNGWNHSKAFTLQNYPEPIRITKTNLDDLQHNCIECHANMTGEIAAHRDVVKNQARCTECHRSVGHMSSD